MIKTQVLFSYLILFLLSLNGMEKVSGQKPLHIITYNILDGFEQKQDTARRTLFIHWIQEQNPDIVSLNELVGFTEQDLQELAKEYGHPYVAIVKEEGYPVGLTSKRPIRIVKKQIEGFWHGMLHAQTYGLNFVVTHLSPFEWKFRLKEAQTIIRYIQESQLDSCLILGDMNAYSPSDADEIETHTELKKNMRHWDKEHPEYGNMRGERFDYSTLSTFLAAGFTDPVQMYVPANQRMSYPTAWSAHREWDDPNNQLYHERLDFIWISASLAPHCSNASVHNGEDTDRISDHYPVSIFLKLP